MTLRYRAVSCLLGLPFDLVNLEGAVARLQVLPGDGAAEILSTPNVNWVILARRHPALRESVLASALVVVDGQLLVWVGRMLGLAVPERVSGADLFAQLQTSASSLRVFFLGGMGHVARRASAALNRAGGSLVGAGGLDPGNGSIASMSRPEVLHAISEGQPDLLVVSLGALRGQAWIMQNRTLPGVRWLTHLGAVVNFVAGDVRRAPRWMQRSGCEWIWRIMQEPHLWQRYAGDGFSLLGLLLTRTLPLRFWRAWYARQQVPATCMPMVTGCGLTLAGAWVSDQDAQALHAALLQIGAHEAEGPVQLNVAQVCNLGPAVIGQLMILRGALALQRRSLELVQPSTAVRRLLHGELAEYLLG